jgi:dTDP-4-amino-4,6-dideoxygalactose transaminase
VAFYDLDPGTLGPQWESLEQALRLEPFAVVGVHYYGVPIDWPRFAALVKAGGAVPIEDAAQGAGGALEGQPLGGMGELAVLSFGRGKGVTGGRGGALLAGGSSWQAAVETIALEAPRGGVGELVALAAQWLLTRPSVYGLPAGLPWLGLGQTVYRPPHAPRGLSALATGVLTITTALAEAEGEARRRNAAALMDRLQGGGCRLVLPPAGARPGWLRLPLRLPGKPNSALTGDSRARALGIYPGYPLVLGDLPGFSRRLVVAEAPIRGARTLARELVTLPTHGALERADLDRMVAWVGDRA